MREQLMEAAAEANEELMDRYLEEGELSEPIFARHSHSYSGQ